MTKSIDLRGFLLGQSPKAYFFRITGPQVSTIPEAMLSRRFWFPKSLTRLTRRGGWDMLEVPKRLLDQKLEELQKAAPAQRHLYGEDVA